MAVTHTGCGGEVFEIMLVPRAFAIEAFVQDGVTYLEEAGEVQGFDAADLADPEHVAYWCCRCRRVLGDADMDSGL